jgi:hypothetical protein
LFLTFPTAFIQQLAFLSEVSAVRDLRHTSSTSLDHHVVRGLRTLHAQGFPAAPWVFAFREPTKILVSYYNEDPQMTECSRSNFTFSMSNPK